MKIVRILSASVLAGAVLLSVAACSQPESNDPKPSATATAAPISPVPSESATTTPSPSANTSTTSPTVTVETETEAVISTIEGYYDFVSNPDSFEKVKQAGSTVTGRTEITETELTEIAASLPEGFQYFDTSNSQNITNSYSQLFARVTQSERTPGVEVSVPVEAVTITGETATVKSALIEVTSKSNTHTLNATEAPYYEAVQINLVKSETGKWVIIPEPPRHSIP